MNNTLKNIATFAASFAVSYAATSILENMKDTRLEQKEEFYSQPQVGAVDLRHYSCRNNYGDVK